MIYYGKITSRVVTDARRASRANFGLNRISNGLNERPGNFWTDFYHHLTLEFLLDSNFLIPNISFISIPNTSLQVQGNG